MPPLTALRAFEAAARLSSFTKAARELHVTSAAVSHQIRGLEKYLGLSLFKRTTRRLELTEQGRIAAEHFREGFQRLARGVSQLRADDAGTSITLSVTSPFATRWLVPRLGRFMRRFPGIDLKVKAGSQPVDFDQDEVDLAVRIGRGGVAGAMATSLFGESVAPLASPAFIRQHGLRRATDLARAPLLHDDSMRRVGRTTGWPEWLGAARVRNVDVTTGTHFDDGHLVLQAAAGGRGVALGRLAYALDDLDARRLRMPFGPVLDLDLRYYLFVPEARAGEPAIAAVRAWFIQEAGAFAPRLQAVVSEASAGGVSSSARPAR
ncbi:MAG: transcriptional regulator GcvA [Steroidobacteraceae bacterium]|nr:transcriptional regulator GcvA [Steroidobacteraceae bacterium]